MTQEDIILKFRINELEECIDLIEDEISNKIKMGIRVYKSQNLVNIGVIDNISE